MQFSILKLAAVALAASSETVLGAVLQPRDLTPAQMVDNIKMVTDKSQALQAPAQRITIISGPLILIGQGPFPQIIVGFTDIVSTVTTALSQMQGSAPVEAGPPSDAIFDAFREFVRVHQVLLNILIGKAGLFQAVPFIGQPVAAVLRQVEGVVDNIALSIIALVESRAQDLKTEAGNLMGTLETAINSYEGLSVLKTITGPLSG